MKHLAIFPTRDVALATAEFRSERGPRGQTAPTAADITTARSIMKTNMSDP